MEMQEMTLFLAVLEMILLMGKMEMTPFMAMQV